jgi:hypothetical protein
MANSVSEVSVALVDDILRLIFLQVNDFILLQRLFKVNKRFNRLINTMISGKLEPFLRRQCITVDSMKNEFYKTPLAILLISNGYNLFRILPNGVLHGQSAKKHYYTNIETIECYLGTPCEIRIKVPKNRDGLKTTIDWYKSWSKVHYDDLYIKYYIQFPGKLHTNYKVIKYKVGNVISAIITSRSTTLYKDGKEAKHSCEKQLIIRNEAVPYYMDYYKYIKPELPRKEKKK